MPFNWVYYDDLSSFEAINPFDQSQDDNKTKNAAIFVTNYYS